MHLLIIYNTKEGIMEAVLERGHPITRQLEVEVQHT